MKRLLISSMFLSALAGVAGCDGGTTPPGTDGGGMMMGMDGGPTILPDGAVVRPPDTGTDGAGGCIPGVEICGDRIDQNCDMRDTSCGDTDGDGIMACRAGDDLTMCDCDDARTDVYPRFGAGVPGAPEICDMRDNDCNGRVDDSAACCEGCASLGTARDRADVCTEDGTCDCSTEPGLAPCAAGQTCCGGGCTDVATDAMNCGFCNSQCTNQADHCEARTCRCGSGPVCDFINMCVGGSCG